MNTMNRWDVFISHADVDNQRFALPLAEALREKGYSVWFDTWAISLGDNTIPNQVLIL